MIKSIWILWVGLVLGPFSVWFVLLGKRKRRGLEQKYPLVLGLLWLATIAFYILFFFLPLPHMVLIVLYATCVLASSFWLFQSDALDLFRFGSVTPGLPKDPKSGSLSQSLLAAGMAVIPLAYLGGLARNLIELRLFSIQWPGSVYIEALKTAGLSLPLAIFLGWLLWKSPLTAQIRTILIFFGSLLCIAVWILIWNAIDSQLLSWLWGGIREPLLFDPWAEKTFRTWVQGFFWLSGALLGIDYLMLSVNGVSLIRRAFYLGLPAGIAYAQMLFILGDWNYYLGALQATFLREQNLSAYSLLAASKAARVPEAFRTPFDLEELAEYRYELGQTSSAIRLWEKMEDRLRERPYSRDLQLRARHYLTQLSKTKPGSHADSNSVELALELIRPTTYLDADWYALLSAIGYLHPEWSDLEIKKRLLAVSPSLQIDLPAITGIPVLRPLLDKLGVAHRCGYADSSRIREALKRGVVPFVSIGGVWSALAGYDAARDAYILYQYPARYENNPWWSGPEMAVVEASSQGPIPYPKLEKSKKPSAHVPIRRAMPAPELERTVHGIGGVCVYLGDTSWISPKEDRGAFLLELGDAYYQQQENDAAAAEAYSQSLALFPNDYVISRMLFLRRRWQSQHQDPNDYTSLFQAPGLPDWAKFPIPKEEMDRVERLILDGTMGQYLLLSWISPIPPKGSRLHLTRLDSAHQAYATLRAMIPGEALYVDSLAAVAHRRGNHREEAAFLDTLSRYNPFGDEAVQFRLAWARYLAEDTAGALQALKKCKGYARHSRYELISGAIECGTGNPRGGLAMLERSLKQNKSESRIHQEWRRCQEKLGSDTQRDTYLKRWEERTQ